MKRMNGSQMRQWREALGWSQAQAAEALGYTRPHYNGFETGRNDIDTALELACEALSARALEPQHRKD